MVGCYGRDKQQNLKVFSTRFFPFHKQAAAEKYAFNPHDAILVKEQSATHFFIFPKQITMMPQKKKKKDYTDVGHLYLVFIIQEF